MAVEFLGFGHYLSTSCSLGPLAVLTRVREKRKPREQVSKQQTGGQTDREKESKSEQEQARENAVREPVKRGGGDPTMDRWME